MLRVQYITKKVLERYFFIWVEFDLLGYRMYLSLNLCLNNESRLIWFNRAKWTDLAHGVITFIC